MSKALKSAIIGLTVASMSAGAGGLSYPYLDTSMWRMVNYGRHRRTKDRTTQWVGHRNKALTLNRKRNKLARKARKAKRRK